MKIQKIIHYCWFGGKEMPKELALYIETWKRYLPEYEIMCWNEENFDINEVDYVREAYHKQKYAFVSDYVRIYALYKYGGIYFDTDVEVLKPFEHLIKDYSVVLCTEGVSAGTIMTGFLAFEKGHHICEDILEYYHRVHFVEENGSLNQYSNTQLLADYLKSKYNVEPSETIEMIADEMIIYPTDYFTAFDGTTQKPKITKNTVCVHHFARSWFTPWENFKEDLRGIRKRILLKLQKNI